MTKLKSPRLLTLALCSALIALGGCSSMRPAKPEAAPMPMVPGYPVVGGASMLPSKNIVQNALNSRDHTTLVAAVKAADLVGVLQAPGPFTVFAPTNAAFDALPAGAVSGLLKPEAKPALVKTLTYHVVPGRLDARDLQMRVRDGNGQAWLKTVSGRYLMVTRAMGGLRVTDEMGRSGSITIGDVFQSNGVIHVVDTVMLPK